MSKSEDIVIQEFRDEKSMELFDKPECLLEPFQIIKLDQYIYDIGHPVWKDVIIKGKKTNYQVSNLGEVKNKSSGEILQQNINPKGYKRINLYYNHKSNPCSVHRLVAIAFIPNPENKPQVNHINGKKKFNWVGNLEWVNNAENQKHAYITGLHIPLHGINHGHAKHTEAEVHQVCKLLEKSVPINEIANRLNMSRAFIIGIKYQCNWKDIRSQYNIPESNTYGDRSEEQIKMIDQLLDSGIRNRKEILRRVGLPDTKTNISYVKYRVKIHNKMVNCSTTIP